MIGGIKGNGLNGRQMEKLASGQEGREAEGREVFEELLGPGRILECGLGAVGGWKFFQGN